MFLLRLWRDERGVVCTADLILLTTILGLGLIVGVVVLRNQVVQEFGDLGTAVGELNQGYEYQERSITTSSGTHTVQGSEYDDLPNAGSGQNGGGIDVTSPEAVNENETPGEN